MFGIPLSAYDIDIALIDGMFKLLISTDNIIQSLAWDELVEIPNWRYESNCMLNPQAYLNSAPTARTSDKYRSPWSRSRQATKRMRVEWGITEIGKVEVKVGDVFTSDRKAIFKNIRKNIHEKRMLSLRDHPQQGKTNTCVATAKSSCHFLKDGKYTTFKDW